MAEYYFNLPPITDLTRAQQAALNETEQIALSGGPGTGKSVVSMYRHISNYVQGHSSLLLTYTTTLKRYLEACCKNKNALAAQQVGTALRNKYLTRTRSYYEVIIDEAQDLEPSYFNNICSPVSYGADNNQIVFPDQCTREEELARIFPNNVACTLDKNFRCTKKIMQFARQAFPQAALSSNMINNITKDGDMPSLLLGDWDDWDDIPDDEINSILEIINDYRDGTQNIAILLPWKNSVENYASVLQDNNVDDFSYYYEDKYKFPGGAPKLKDVHITTFKSAKGLEFDTVIIPDFNKMNSIIGRYNVDWKDYYVGCTRARWNLFLFSNKKIASLNGVVDVNSI